MNQGELLYSGKAKSVYLTDDPEHLLLSFRNDTSAFDGKKMTELARKGAVNNQFNAWVMTQLAQAGIPTHFVRLLSAHESLVLNLDMVPVECVVRNRVAGGLMRRLSRTEGELLNPPVFELFLKDDALGDPMINESHAVTLGWASSDELARMKVITLRVNEILTRIFADAGLILVDFKLEFGRHHGEMVLGDEFSPDGCRLWDAQTLEKMDKDRFRQDLGGVIEAYEEVGRRLGITFINA